MTSEFSFRQRIEIAPTGRLPFDEKVVALNDEDGVIVTLQSLEERPICESVKIAIWGDGYRSREEAQAAGERWRNAVQRALAGIGVGANFGFRNPHMGGPTDAVLEELSGHAGVAIYRDSWDVLVVPTAPRAKFISMTADGYMTPNEDAVLSSFAVSAQIAAPVNEIAFDLWAASMRTAHLADVRVVLLVMAIECLLVRTERPAESLTHLENLVQATVSNDDLESGDCEALANALRSLRYRSTTKAAAELARRLDPSSYADDPASMIAEAFKMRHSLVHGGQRPDLERVRYVGANLERMVGDLIAGPEITAAVKASGSPS